MLKGQKAKPTFKPSGMETETEPSGDGDESDAGEGEEGNGAERPPRKRAGSSKRRKTA